MSRDRTVMFAEPVRTAIGSLGGSLKDVAATALGASAIRAAVAPAGVGENDIETVVMGNVIQAGMRPHSRCSSSSMVVSR